MAKQLKFPLGFDLKAGTKQAISEWKSTYRDQVQAAVDKKPIKLKLQWDAKGLNLKQLKEWVQASKAVENIRREALKTQKQEIQVQTELEKKNKAVAATQKELANLTTARAKAENAAATAAANRRYAQQRAQNAEMQGLSQSIGMYREKSSLLSQIMQKATVYFGLHQVVSFLKNVKDVTKEMELQRSSLGALIGDMGRANLMYSQIKTAALKSPFNISELTKYTKQVAAYKIDTEELFDTTMRLADVSAGLGVSMDRIVLAYGQIRATGYLRATEVRQLTEAGLPIVEALAEQMSELGTKTYSAAEVMDLISKRAISFEQVKEIFEDLTSAGGMFYKMQEKQADTLYGKWANLKDAYTMMLEEIGRSDSAYSAMEGMINMLHSLMRNWEKLAAAIKIVVGSYIGLKAGAQVMTFLSISTRKYQLATLQLQRSIVDLRVAQKSGGAAAIFSAKMQVGAARAQRQAALATTLHEKAWHRLRAAIMSNPLGAIVTIIVSIISAVSLLSSEINKLDKELSKIDAEGFSRAEQESRNFEKLASTVRDSIDGSKEQADALKELKRAYGEFLPAQDKSIIQLLREEEAYESVSEAIKEKIRLQSHEQKLEHTSSHFDELLSGGEATMRGELRDAGLTREQISQFFANIRKAVEEEALNWTDADYKKKLSEIFEASTGLDWGFSKILNKTGTRFLLGTPIISEYIHGLNAYRETMKDVVSEFETYENKLGEFKQSYKELHESLSQLTSDAGPKFSFAWDQDMLEQKTIEYQETITEMLSEAFSKGFVGEDEKEALEGDFDKILDVLAEKSGDISWYAKLIRKEYSNLFPTTEASVVNKSIMSVAAATGISMDLVKGYMQDNKQSTQDWKKEIAGYYEEASKSALTYLSLWAYAKKTGDPAENELKNKADEAQNLVKFFEELNKIWNFSVGKGSGGSGSGAYKKDPWIEKMENRMKYMEDFQKGVDKLSKNMARQDAIDQERLVMLNRGISLGFSKDEISKMEGNSDELIAWYEESIKKVVDKIRNGNEALAKNTSATAESVLAFKSTHKPTQDLQKLLDTLYGALTNFKTDKLVKEMEEKLKKMSEDISRTKTAKDFFDKMLNLTGDRKLSATLTMSVYGQGAEDLGQSLANQMIESAKEAFSGLDITQYLDEGTGYINYAALRKLIEEEKLKGEDSKLSKTQLKEAEKFVANGEKANADWLHNLYKTYEKAMTFEQRRTQVIAREEENRKKIRDKVTNKELDEGEGEKLIKVSEAKERADLDTIDLEEFKKSEEWVKTFENIEKVGTKSISNLLALLKDFIATNKDLTAEQVRTLMTEYEKLYQGLITRNPIKAMTEGTAEYFRALREVRRARKADGFKNSLKEVEVEEKQAKKEVRQAYSDIRTAKNTEQETKAKERLTKAEAKLAAAQKKRGEIEKNLRDAQDKQKEALAKVQAGLENTISGYNQLKSVIESISETFGVDETSDLGVALSSVSQALTMVVGVLGAINAMITLIETHPLVLALSAAIMAIIGAILLFKNLAVRDAEQEIKRQDKILEDLQYQYERLEQAAEKAFGTEYIDNYQQRLENLQAQITAYEKQLEAERSKGKQADEDKIKDYETAIRDTKDAIEEMQTEVSERILGTDLASAARDFADAWIEAYKEFGNTTDAMSEKFQEMIQNMVVESFAAKIMQTALDPIFSEIDQLTKDGALDMSEASMVAGMANDAVTNMNVGMSNLMSALEAAGISVRGMGGDLTGISRDIASASEESILGLAAGINTQNFYISQIPTKIDEIIGILRGGGAVAGTDGTLQDLITLQNQHLSYLPTIAQNTADTAERCQRAADACEKIASSLNSVIKPVGTQATHTMSTSIRG